MLPAALLQVVRAAVTLDSHVVPDAMRILCQKPNINGAKPKICFETKSLLYFHLLTCWRKDNLFGQGLF